MELVTGCEHRDVTRARSIPRDDFYVDANARDIWMNGDRMVTAIQGVTTGLPGHCPEAGEALHRGLWSV